MFISGLKRNDVQDMWVIIFDIPPDSIYLKLPYLIFLQKEAMLCWCSSMVFGYTKMTTEKTRIGHMTQGNINCLEAHDVNGQKEIYQIILN